jgi:hypothetical protein
MWSHFAGCAIPRSPARSSKPSNNATTRRRMISAWTSDRNSSNALSKCFVGLTKRSNRYTTCIERPLSPSDINILSRAVSRSRLIDLFRRSIGMLPVIEEDTRSASVLFGTVSNCQAARNYSGTVNHGALLRITQSAPLPQGVPRLKWWMFFENRRARCQTSSS